MRINNIVLVICCVITALSLQAEKTSSKAKNISPKEWLLKNATHEQKKLIVNLQYNNALSGLNGTTYAFVSHSSPEFKMINNFSQPVRNYLIEKFDSLIFDDIRCQLKISTSDLKITSMKHHRATQQEIENFISDTYRFVEW